MPTCEKLHIAYQPVVSSSVTICVFAVHGRSRDAFGRTKKCKADHDGQTSDFRFFVAALSVAVLLKGHPD